jgi:hypothetical protein
VSGPIFSSLTPGQQPLASPAIFVSTDSIAFGDVIVGQTSSPQQVVVTSNGSQGLSLDSISIGGRNAADFSETDNCSVLGLLIYSGIGCGSSAGSSQATPQTSHQPQPQTAAVPSIQPAGGTFTAPQSVSITDETAGAIIHYTADGSTPSASSRAYSAAIPLSSAAVVQAIAAAPSASTSAVASASFKFPTPTGSYVTVTPTVTATGSTKSLQMSPVLLTLNVQ